MTVHTVLVTVAAAGTAQQAVTDTTVLVAALNVAPLWSNAGAAFFGRAGLDRTTGANVIQRFATGAAAPFLLTTGDGRNSIQISDYRFDAATNGEAFLVTYWIR